MSAIEEMTNNVFGATLTRRKFVERGGAMIVGVSLVGAGLGGKAAKAVASPTLDPSQITSWLEIRADNTIIARTGRPEMGQGSASTAYAQFIAEELNFPFESITMLMGDTDKTPDGGLAAGYMGLGRVNVQRVAAYTYQALLSLASTKLGVPVGSLAVKDGIVSGGGKTITYGQLVQGQQLNLSIPTTGSALASNLTVTGNPPTKPVSEYKIVGTSLPGKNIPDLVTGAATFISDVRLPGMLHASTVKPKTLGSTLISVGALDKKRYPTAQVVVKGNLVAVLSPSQWEAIGAAQAVAAGTKWTEWQGLPGSGNLLKAMQSADYSAVPPSPGARNKGSVAAGLGTAAKTLSATYETPYVKHGPIGPSITLADVRSDGSVHIWGANQKPQALRAAMAIALGISPENVVVHSVAGAGQYGRSNGGIEGSEADAVILSQAVGRPVRLQWTRPEDMLWSTSSYSSFANVKAGLDAKGNMVAFQADYYAPGHNDERPLGALLAGLPTDSTPGSPPQPFLVYTHSTVWPYDKVPNLQEIGYGTAQIGQAASPLKVGLRAHSMRTPQQRQQNFALEGMINEAAAAAGVDPIEYRLRHTTDDRLIAVLNTLKQESGWQTRPSPNPKASATGSTPVTGQGLSVMLRSNAYIAAAADVTVIPKTGKVRVNRFTIVVEPGIVVNPAQLKRNFEGGVVQGVSEALYEGVAFDKSKITSTDWVTYPIMRFTELPKIKVVILNRPDLNVVGGGGEPPNGVTSPTVTAAFFDATGKQARTLPLRPANVRAILQA
jgi:nicotinate dehydrogenase subunit B